MTKLDSIFKSRDITLPTKAYLVKAMVFPVVMYGCENWTVKKAECQRIDAFELWCRRRLLRVPWTARRSNQSILKEISPWISLEGMITMRWSCLGIRTVTIIVNLCVKSMGKQWKQCQTLFWGAPKSLQMVTAAMKLKDTYSWKESYDQPRQHIKKQSHYFANKGPSSQGYDFASSHVWM